MARDWLHYKVGFFAKNPQNDRYGLLLLTPAKHGHFAMKSANEAVLPM